MLSKYVFCICLAFCLYSINLAQDDSANSNLVVEVTSTLIPSSKIEQQKTDPAVIDSNIGLATASLTNDNKNAAQQDSDGEPATTPIVFSTTAPPNSDPITTTKVIKDDEIKGTEEVVEKTSTAMASTPKRKKKTKSTTTTATITKKRRPKKKTTVKPELMNEFKAKLNEFLELPCGYESDQYDDQIKWEKVGGVSSSYY